MTAVYWAPKSCVLLKIHYVFIQFTDSLIAHFPSKKCNIPKIYSKISRLTCFLALEYFQGLLIESVKYSTKKSSFWLEFRLVAYSRKTLRNVKWKSMGYVHTKYMSRQRGGLTCLCKEWYVVWLEFPPFKPCAPHDSYTHAHQMYICLFITLLHSSSYVLSGSFVSLSIPHFS